MFKVEVQPGQMGDLLAECGDAFALMIDLCTLEEELTPRAKLALITYGKLMRDSFELAETMLRDFQADSKIRSDHAALPACINDA